MSMTDKNIKVVLPCHFGLEKVTKFELIKLGFLDENILLNNGEVLLNCKISDIPILNINLRTAERVLILINEKECKTFDELYNFVYNSKIEEYLEKDSCFVISKANQDKNSLLHSSMSIQSIAKKAMVDKLKIVYSTDTLLENGIKFAFRIKFNKNICRLLLDTSGDSLHKRGYRIKSGLAPIEETLAASIVLLTPFKAGRYFLDPFCGSGTFAIEAAMYALNIAPGINRVFTSERWDNIIDKSAWDSSFKRAKENIKLSDSIKNTIFASDINKEIVFAAKENAKRAGVDEYINFQVSDVKDIKLDKQYGFLITNPPYGERLEDEETLKPIYANLGKLYDRLNNWSMYMITSYENAERLIRERKADKNRKIYNGMLKTYLYQYIGAKPKV